VQVAGQQQYQNRKQRYYPEQPVCQQRRDDMQHKRQIVNLIADEFARKHPPQQQCDRRTRIQQQLQPAQAIEKAAQAVHHQHQPHNQADRIAETRNQHVIPQHRHQQRRPVHQQCHAQYRQLRFQRICFIAVFPVALPDECAQSRIGQHQTNQNNWHNQLSARVRLNRAHDIV